jgi:RNA recognition motif-containing protein
MPAHKLYVGNLPFRFTEVDLKELFQGFGSVRNAQVILDRETGRSRGFGFVEMDSAEALQQAIAGLHERNVQGRTLTVNEARERDRGPRPSAPAPRPDTASFQPSTGARPAWSDAQRPRGDERGGPKDRRGRERERGGEREPGRGKRSKGWDDDEGF